VDEVYGIIHSVRPVGCYKPIIHLPPVQPSTDTDVWAAPVNRTALGLHDRVR
jgi:hypothetical protein